VGGGENLYELEIVYGTYRSNYNRIWEVRVCVGCASYIDIARNVRTTSLELYFSSSEE
jgi:hypothetical protein